MKKQTSKPKKQEPGELQLSRLGFAGVCGTVAGCAAAIRKAQEGALDVIARLEYVLADKGGFLTAEGRAQATALLEVFREKWRAAYEGEKAIDGIRAELREP